MPVPFIYDRLGLELASNPGGTTDVLSSPKPGTVMDTLAYQSHPHVESAKREGRPLPLPVAIYMDEVAYSSALAGRSDTVIGFSVINLLTNKRHPAAVIRSLDQCRCGCRGWCTVFVVLLNIAWQFLAMAEGRTPPLRHDNTPWAADDPAGVSRLLGFTTAIIRITGDWAEFVKTLGLMAWSSVFIPCFLCHGS